ncbi:MAG: response regulator [Gallionella sp.]|jgi:FixJ family two-component response regulator
MSAAQQVVFVVDDDDALRDSIGWLLESDNLEARMFSRVAEFLACSENKQDGCLLLDIRMPGMNGMELLAGLRETEIFLPVIMITGHGDVAMAVRAIKLGAFDFLPKPFNARDLLERVHAALALNREEQRQRRLFEEKRSGVSTLTGREMEVFRLMVEGDSSKEIALKLGNSPKTVDVQRASIMKKLNVRTLAEAVKLWFLVE